MSCNDSLATLYSGESTFMLQLMLKPHRVHLRSGTAEPQKLFAMLRVIPQMHLAQGRPPLAFLLAVDTSGSMHNNNLVSKLEQAIQAAHALIDDPHLQPDDQVSIVHFDDNARALLPLSPLLDRVEAHAAVDALRNYNGQTYMAKALRCAIDELRDLSPQVAKRVVLLTDGQTGDEAECGVAAGELAEMNVPIIAIGVGETYNEDLLRRSASVGRGRPYHLDNLVQLKEVLQLEVQTSSREVVTDATARLDLVKGVRLDHVTRVYPSLAEIEVRDRARSTFSDAGRGATESTTLRLGNIPAGDYTVFALEFTVAGLERPASRARLARLSLRGFAMGTDELAETEPQDLVVTFTADEDAVTDVDMEVLGYVQQKNIDSLVQEAVAHAGNDATRARRTLQQALGLTQKLRNTPMTQMLQSALDELDRTGRISSNTRKSVTLGNRTRTVKIGVPNVAPGAANGIPSEEEIRRLTGA
jgi:Ca-activated chloride channel family protein